MNGNHIQALVRYAARALLALLMAVGLIPSGKAQTKPANSSLPYLDTSLPLEKRVDDLVSRMTLEEKVRQMQHVGAGHPPAGRSFLRLVE